tara:strand:- start:243 stop:1031 length:789 start_codon:yes stop_codon:yes gene_type:complete
LDLKTHRSAGAVIGYHQAWPIRPLLEGAAITPWFDQPHRALKQNAKVDARLLQLPSGPVFVKQYKVASRLRRTFVTLTGFRARRMFRLSLCLLAIGVRVPQPLAYVLDRRHDRLSSFFVCEALQARDLKSVACGPGLDEAGGEARVFSRVGEMLVALHRAGFSHGDMKWANLMVDDASQELILIDLDGVRRPWLFRNKRFGRDLARFILNARELGVAPESIDALLVMYARARGRSVQQVRADLRPAYNKLARRHRDKYGSTV